MAAATLPDRARALYEKRSYTDVAELLRPLSLDELQAQPQLAFWLADAQRRLGETRAALDLVLATARAAQRSSLPRLPYSRLNLEGMLRLESGDVGGAETAWRELLARASRFHQDEFIARANNNLGIIYTLQFRPVEAVTSYERAIAAYRVLGLRRGIAQSCQNLGITYRELGQADEADEHFVSAMRYAREDGSEDELARAEQERGLLIYLVRRDARLARETVRRALRRFAALGDPLGFADALRVLAMIELGEGNAQVARGHAGHALEHVAGRHPLLEAEALEVLARLDFNEGASHLAEPKWASAEHLFASMQAQAWGRAFRERVAGLAIGQEGP